MEKIGIIVLIFTIIIYFLFYSDIKIYQKLIFLYVLATFLVYLFAFIIGII